MDRSEGTKNTQGVPWEEGLPCGQTRRGRFNVLFSSERLLQDRVPDHARRLVPLCCLIQNSGYLFVFIGVHSRFSPDNDSLVAQLVGGPPESIPALTKFVHKGAQEPHRNALRFVGTSAFRRRDLCSVGFQPYDRVGQRCVRF